MKTAAGVGCRSGAVPPLPWPGLEGLGEKKTQPACRRYDPDAFLASAYDAEPGFKAPWALPGRPRIARLGGKLFDMYVYVCGRASRARPLGMLQC